MSKHCQSVEARQKAKQRKAPTSQASGFVEEEMHAYKRGEKSIKSPEQAIAIGLSKARKSGIKIPRRKKNVR